MIKKFVLALIIIFLFNFNYSYAEKIKKFEITGNDRISDETIILFSGTKVNENIDTNNLNDIIKKLYETNFFKDISLSFEKNVLTINVVESPLIQTVSIEGIKKQSFVDQIKALLLQKEKSSFNQNKIKSDQNIILNTLRMNGYYFSEIKTNIKKNDNNTVDIIYDINLGKKALIKNIKFVGNKVFKDSKLRKVIVSEEAKFWKFISSKKNVDVKRFKLDENLLKNFYKNNGYYKVKINSSFAQIIDDKYFEIVFNIDAGQRYFFNELNLNLPVDYNSKDFENLNKLLTELKLKPYSLNRIENILDEIDDIALGKNYEFVSASYEEKIVNNNQINLDINLKDTEKFFVERINIYGNNITSEKVIRNKLLLDEGDPFNELLANKSFNEIKALRLFKNVNTDIETSRENMTKIININVEEKPTGEIFAAAGTGTQGSSISLGITENNYLGEGKQLGTNLSLSDDSLQGRLFINEPNYKNSNKSFNRSFERSEEDYLTNYGYKTEKTGFGFGTYYEQYRDIFFAPSINTSYESITTNSVASASKKKQQGDYLDLNLNYDIALNKLNQNFNPTDGYKFIFSQELPIYSEDYTLINRLNYTKYFETNNSLVFSLGFFTASSNSISNDDARITKRIFIPSRKLRGFEAGKIGPKDGTDFIGGNYGSAFNVATTLPNLFADVQNLDFSFFYDAANVWGVDYDSSIDENSKIRSSTGLAVEWFTPVGPLSLSYAIPLTKSSTDKTETVRFNIGTTF